MGTDFERNRVIERIRECAGPAISGALMAQSRNSGADVSPLEIAVALERHGVRATSAEVVEAIGHEGFKLNGWRFDSARQCFAFTMPHQPPAPAPAPGVELSASNDPLERANLRWLSSAEVKRQYPSRADYFNAVKLGLEVV